MKSRKKVVLSAFITLFLLIFSACGASENRERASTEDTSFLGNTNDEDGMTNPEENVSYDSEEQKEVSKEPQQPFERKIVKSAKLDMEAKDASSLYSKLTKHGIDLGGYEFNYNISNEETYSVIHAVYKIPPEKLKEFIDFAGVTGKIINSTMSSEDITDSYYEVKTRLETKRKSLEQYYKLLQSAKTVEEITSLQHTIDQITEEIEVNEGKLKMWNHLVDMATVELYIRQENDPIKIKKEIHWNTLGIGDMGYLIKNGLVSLLNFIISLLQWIVIALVVASPVWGLIGIVLFLFLKARKRKKGE